MAELAFDSVVLYDDTPAMSHRFAADAVTVVLGGNLAGKSRLCRMAAGLDVPHAGHVTLDGAPMTVEHAALVFQAFVNYPNFTVRENLEAPLRRLDEPARSRRVDEIAERLGLTDLLARLPQQLSGGQQQRVAIGRALAKAAPVLILDAPLVNLDYKLRESLLRELPDLLRQTHTTVIFATPDPAEAMTIADELLVLHQGRVLQSGAPLTVYAEPQSRTVADLLSDPHVNWNADFGVRPGNLRLSRDGADDIAFDARPLSIETDGSATILHVDIDGAHWVAVLDGLHDLHRADSIELFASPQDLIHV